MRSVVEAQLWERGMETHRHNVSVPERVELKVPRSDNRKERGGRSQTTLEECNLVAFVRKQRFEWVGHTLRRHESFPARRMLMKQQKPYEEGSVLMDAPRHNDMDELAELAQDRQSWRATKHAIGSSKQCSNPP